MTTRFRAALCAAATAAALGGSLLIPVAPTAWAAPVPAAPAPTYGELTPDGAFTDPLAGAGPWWSSTGTPNTIGGGSLKNTVAAGTSQPWDAIVGRNGINLRAGVRYTLSFEASADVPGTRVRATVQEGQGGYRAPLDERITLGPQPRTFRWTFVSTVDTRAVPGDTGGKADPWGQVTFQLGGQPQRTGFTFGKVSLTTSTAREGFFVDPDSNAMKWYDGRDRDPEHPVPPVDARRAAIKAAVADHMTVRWFGGWNKDVRRDVSEYVGRAAAAGQLPTIVAYDIPGRDCKGASGGGAAGDAREYKEWIKAFAEGIAGRPALVVLEPDAVAQAYAGYPSAAHPCLSEEEREARFDMLWYANQRLDEQGPLVKTYLDAGNASWTLGDRLDDTSGIGLGNMAYLLGRSGISLADGFSENVANFHATDIADDYGRRLAARVKQDLGVDTTFVVDTGRNGNGSYKVPADPAHPFVGFCNPPGRALGTPARAGQGGGAAYYLWVKNPGDSDGSQRQSPVDCAGSTVDAGQFSPDLAWGLIDGKPDGTLAGELGAE
ncbi:glycoside hydrolase family 6 protein [Streptomyces sp. NPDC001941]|uniref:glycoside hydrolase family 6 protein n=1 Tax=Streptomyces sp. NPDC001941 TaxID=3154659 RepID=UPI0033344BB3